MLKKWCVENFKSIISSGDVELAPVTVFAGLNNSGKSSFLQSILMIAQTLSNPLSELALLPNGPLVQLGRFENVLNIGAFANSITVGFGIDNKVTEDIWVPEIEDYVGVNRSVLVEVNVTFSLPSANVDNETPITLKPDKVEVTRASMEVSSLDPSIRDAWKLQLKKTSLEKVRNFLSDVTEEESLIEPEDNMYSGKVVTLFADKESLDEVVSKHFFHFLPESTYYKKSSTQNEKRYSKVNNKLEEKVFPRTSVQLKPAISYHTQSNYDENISEIKKFFARKIRYLGPLRAEPNAKQGFSPSGQWDDVGSKGEYAATVFDAYKDTQITWFHPTTKELELGTLQEAVNSWARYLTIADEVKVEAAGYNGVSWQVVPRIGGKALPLSAMGVGVSQILPILVMGLLSPKGSLLIIEQPELHLHPRVQSRLGDFFVGLSKCGKQCLIETHSENLVNQLRLHIVEAGGLDKSDSKIYFVEQDAEKGAIFEEIEISPNGNILNWPDGFFDESMIQEDKITTASFKRRMAKNG